MSDNVAVATSDGGNAAAVAIVKKPSGHGNYVLIKKLTFLSILITTFKRTLHVLLIPYW